MDLVLFDEGSRQVRFRDPVWPDTDDPYAGSRFTVELRDAGLEVDRTVFMLGYEWENLAAYFLELEESWKGWDGEKTWNSVEHDLAVAATSDSHGHCHFRIAVRNGGIPTWQASMTDLEVNAGEDLTRLARSVRLWTLSVRPKADRDLLPQSGEDTP
jgi:hypothetical protein